MRTIKLTKGYEATVDDEDYDFLMQWKWYAARTPYIYAVRNSYEKGKQRRVFMHRILCGTPDDLFTDHRNADTLDNRKENLRVATPAQNAWNRAAVRGSSSKHKGVCWNRRSGKWQAQIKIGRKNHYLGLFLSEKDAAGAYAERAAINRGTKFA